jgi:hypothetical protein
MSFVAKIASLIVHLKNESEACSIFAVFQQLQTAVNLLKKY